MAIYFIDLNHIYTDVGFFCCFLLIQLSLIVQVLPIVIRTHST